jgi:hypothetical protein
MSSRVVRSVCASLSLLTAVHTLSGVVLASTPLAAPEIDGGSLAAGLGLLAAGILLVRARRSSK